VLLQAFVKATEEHGRSALDEIVETVRERTDNKFTKEEIVEYNNVFWKRYKV
jgi:hypothetical protein